MRGFTIMATVTTPMTTAELLAMPDDDSVERWLIDGELWEIPMTKRNRFHSRIMVRVGKLLDNWLDGQPEPRGAVLCGEAGVRLRQEPDTTVGVDVVYVSAETLAQQTDESTLIEGLPVLVVEILSPSDTQEIIDQKMDTYRGAGVPLIWVIDPHDQTVTVYRPDAAPELVNVNQDLTAEPHLPGFRVSVATLFA
jgi:Uma2 family endonuclease